MRRPRARTILVLLATFLAPARAFDLGPETRDYDQKHLALEVALDVDRGEVLGTARLTLEPTGEAFRVLRLHCEDTEVRSVGVSRGDEAPLPVPRFRAADGLLEIEFERDFGKGDLLTVEIRYLSRPTAGLFFFRPSAAHPEIPIQIWSQGEGTDNRHWFPCYDLPDDRLTSEVAAIVPEALEVFSNGDLVSAEAGPGPGTKRWHYRLDQPHVTYLVTLVAGTFETVKETAGAIDLTYHVPPGRGEDVRLAFGNTADMVGCFEEFTGRPYPWPIYRQIVVWDFSWGGMENTSATTLNQRALHDERSHLDYRADDLVAHELAHQWFGDLVTCRTFDHIWLNEGFATYFADLWVERHFGRSEFLVRRRESTTAWVAESTPTSRAALGRTSRTQPLEMESSPYRKGSAFLFLLRAVLGDDAFRDAIRRYVERTAFQSVESDAFQAAVEEASGQDLDWLFDPWVVGSGYPEFEVAWEWRAEARQAVLRVKQVQAFEKDRGLFRVPVVVAFTLADGKTERRTVWIEKKEHEFVVDLPARPEVVRFDEGNTVPKSLKFDRTVGELAAALELDPDVTGRMDAADLLAGKGEAAGRALAKALADEPEVFVRRSIAQALGKTPGEPSRKALLDALERDRSSEVRKAAAAGLASFEGDEVESGLRHAIEDDASDFVAGAAAESLGKVAKADAESELVALLERSSYADVVRRGAVAGLVAIGDEKSLPHVLRFAEYRWGAGQQHELARASLAAAVKLAGADHAAVRARLVERLTDPYFRTRQTAATLLADAGRLDAVGALMDAAAAERLGPVKRHFEAQLKRLAEVAAKRDADPLAGRSEKEVARMLEAAKAEHEKSAKETEAKKAWLELLESRSEKGD